MRRGDRPHIQTILESEIDVIDVLHALAQCRRHIHVRLQPLEKSIVAEVQQSRVTVDENNRVVQIVDVDFSDRKSVV